MLGHQSNASALVALLNVANIVVLRVGLERCVRCVAKNLGTNKDQQVSLDLVCLAATEQISEYRDSSKYGHALVAFSQYIFKKASQNQYFAVVDDDGCLNDALIGNKVDRAGRRLCNA